MEKSAHARTIVIDRFLKKLKTDKANEENVRLLSNGFIPESLQDEFNDELAKELQNVKTADTDLDKMQYSNFFYLHPEKIVGKEVPGSGFINPVNTVGNIKDLESVIPFTIPTMKDKTSKKSEAKSTPENLKKAAKASSNIHFVSMPKDTPAKIKVHAAGEDDWNRKLWKSDKDLYVEVDGVMHTMTDSGEPMYPAKGEFEFETQHDDVEFDINNLDEKLEGAKPKVQPQKENTSKVSVSSQLKIKRIRSEEKKNIGDGPTLLTIDASLKKYNPGITEAEIKAWVYYKRRFGNPMRGWEAYYLKESKTKETLVYSNSAVYLKDQQFRDVKMVPADTLIGKKTKFKNEYDKAVYWVVKNEAGELYYIAQSNFTEKEIGNEAAESELIELVKQKGLCYSDGDFIPIPLYTYGDIYDIKDKLVGKYSRELQKNEGGYYQTLIDKFGKEIADWHLELVNEAIKVKGEFYFDDPQPTKRPFLASENPISREFLIHRLNEESGVDFEKIFDAQKTRKNRYERYDEETMSYSLFKAYEYWFQANVSDSMLEKTTKRNIIDFYFNSRKISGGAEMTEKEKDEIRLNARIEGEKYYAEFLATALTRNDTTALNITFNRKYNSISKLNVDKVPVAFETNANTLNVPDFELKPVQRNGIAFMAATNSGCLAYDVGFGKTLTAIHNLAALLKQGAIKRPLIIVPKQVYNNWIREMFGFWTNGKENRFEQFEGSRFVNGALTGTKYKLNTWFNLNKSIEFKNALLDADTITIVTYEGFYKIGFSESLYEQLFQDLFTILTKGKTDATARQEEKEKENIKKMLGVGIADTVIDVDTCGFDYLVFDEAHAFKNVFNSVPLDEGEKNVWRLSQKSSPTKRAVKAFFHSLYIQKKYNGNVNLLTATPFTNSPLEIFSMLSLVGYETLRKYHLQNLFEFLGLFIETEVEYAVSHTNEIVLNTVIKSFKNKNLLRDILYRHFDYQDDPKVAGVKRPCKLNFPNNRISTYLEMSVKQAEGQAIVRAEAASYDPKHNRGAMGRALNWAKNNAFSPFLLKDIETYETLEELIEQSPKLNYTLQCIKSIKDWHSERGQEMSGQVIYSNRGVDLFKDFKKALEEECGFKRDVEFGESFVDEVEIILGGGTDKELEHKELVKDAFNKGYCKVIIGTGTIKEGVNLQERGTCEYNLDLDWNPTDFKQLEGRIHRQGNKFKYVRITVPLVQNTLDSFINQKLDEKSKRIQSIWDKTNQSNSIDEYNAVDPMEIKFALIDNADELLKMKVDKDKQTALKASVLSEEKFKAVQKINTVINEFRETWEGLKTEIDATFENHKTYIGYLKKYRAKKDLNKTTITSIDDCIAKVNENIVLFEDFKNTGNYKSLFEVFRHIQVRNYNFRNNTGSSWDYSDLVKEYTGEYYYGGFETYSQWNSKKLIATYGDMKKLERMVLQPYGLTVDDNFDGLKNKFKEEHESHQNELHYLESLEYKEKAMVEIQAELKRRAAERGTIEERVAAFAEYNYLLSYPFVKETADQCEIPQDEAENPELNQIVKDELKKPKEETLDSSKLSSNEIKGDKEKKAPADEKKEVLRKLNSISEFMPHGQMKTLKKFPMEFADSINDLYEVIKKMPSTYQTKDIDATQKIAHLHYFRAGSDWFIIEKDMEEDDQRQAFGYTVLNHDWINAEFGYIDIKELQKLTELDLHFTPQSLNQALETIGQPRKRATEPEPIVEPEPRSEAVSIEDMQAALEGAEVALEFAESDAEKTDLQDYIDGLKTAIELHEFNS